MAGGYSAISAARQSGGLSSEEAYEAGSDLDRTTTVDERVADTLDKDAEDVTSEEAKAGIGAMNHEQGVTDDPVYDGGDHVTGFTSGGGVDTVATGRSGSGSGSGGGSGGGGSGGPPSEIVDSLNDLVSNIPSPGSVPDGSASTPGADALAAVAPFLGGGLGGIGAANPGGSSGQSGESDSGGGGGSGSGVLSGISTTVLAGIVAAAVAIAAGIAMLARGL